jgi:CheY-like chemotaxis protein
MTGPQRIALVDDDDIFRFITERLLRRAGFEAEILQFPHGQAFLDHLLMHTSDPEQLPDVVMLDLFMPVLDGWGVLDRYQSLRPRLAQQPTLYVVSSSIDPSDIKRVSGFPEVRSYLTKPLSDTVCKAIALGAEPIVT